MVQTFEITGPSDEMHAAAAALGEHAYDDAMRYGTPGKKFDEVWDLTERFCEADLRAADADPAAEEYLAAFEVSTGGDRTAMPTAGGMFCEVNTTAVCGIAAMLSLSGKTEVSDETVRRFGDALDEELLAIRRSRGEIGEDAAFSRGVSALTARRLWGLVHDIDGLQKYAALMSERKQS